MSYVDFTGLKERTDAVSAVTVCTVRIAVPA